MNFLSGYKTYIVGAAGIATAIAGYATGQDTLPQMIQLIITSLLGMTIRSGIATSAK